MLEHLPELEPEEPEPEPEPEEKGAQTKAEEDSELAKKKSAIAGQTLDKVGPICKQITDHVDRTGKTPKDELDEEQLVKNVKPLLEEANSILQHATALSMPLTPMDMLPLTQRPVLLLMKHRPKNTAWRRSSRSFAAMSSGPSRTERRKSTACPMRERRSTLFGVFSASPSSRSSPLSASS
jgi:hypothetical protein